MEECVINVHNSSSMTMRITMMIIRNPGKRNVAKGCNQTGHSSCNFDNFEFRIKILIFSISSTRSRGNCTSKSCRFLKTPRKNRSKMGDTKFDIFYSLTYHRTNDKTLRPTTPFLEFTPYSKIRNIFMNTASRNLNTFENYSEFGRTDKAFP